MPPPRTLGLAFVFVWFLAGGIGHFVATDFFLRIIPPWVPSPREVIWASGVLEFLGAAGLLRAATRPWAGAGLFLLTLAVTPANVHMLQHPEQFPEFPVPLLVARLVVQAGLLACIAWSTWPRPYGAPLR